MMEFLHDPFVAGFLAGLTFGIGATLLVFSLHRG